MIMCPSKITGPSVSSCILHTGLAASEHIEFVGRIGLIRLHILNRWHDLTMQLHPEIDAVANGRRKPDWLRSGAQTSRPHP